MIAIWTVGSKAAHSDTYSATEANNAISAFEYLRDSVFGIIQHQDQVSDSDHSKLLLPINTSSSVNDDLNCEDGPSIASEAQFGKTADTATNVKYLSEDYFNELARVRLLSALGKSQKKRILLSTARDILVKTAQEFIENGNTSEKILTIGSHNVVLNIESILGGRATISIPGRKGGFWIKMK